MSTAFMLDTNTASYILKRNPVSAWRTFHSLKSHKAVMLSSVTEGELRYGLARVGAGAHRLEILEDFLNGVSVLAWDSDAAITYAALRAEQEMLGKPLSPLDTMIAAHALAVGATLVTHDAAFQYVRQLPLEDWAIEVS